MYFRVVKQRQLSKTVEYSQVPFIERSSTARKEFFEYTRGVLRAYVKPAHLGALIFNFQPVLEGRDRSASSGPNCSDNVSPNNKVSVVEVQWCVQPKRLTTRTSWTFQTTCWSKSKHS